RLARAKSIDDAWYEEFDGLLTRAQEMIYKEQNILFPICAENFSTEEWYQIYKDTAQYEEIFGVKRTAWAEAEAALATQTTKASGDDNTIALIGGSLTVDQLNAMLNTMPMEVTFVDHEDINRYFNDGEKVFKRPTTAIGRDVYSCHPPKIEPIVRGIIESFRKGERGNVAVWLEKVGRPFYVNYMAVRDQNNNYLGTLELVQDMQFAKDHFKRS
ncbi:MAG: PAS domain-containing protein, partial [Veillonella sp.]|nr:PAS domain-containing protein [Veillonella sp.]